MFPSLFGIGKPVTKGTRYSLVYGTMGTIGNENTIVGGGSWMDDCCNISITISKL